MRMFLSGEERWEQDIPHDPRSEKLVRMLADIDEEYNNDTFNFKFGGDGDNGEELLYLFDIYFEVMDFEERNKAKT